MLLCNVQINALQNDNCYLKCQLVCFKYLILAEFTFEANIEELQPLLYRCGN